MKQRVSWLCGATARDRAFLAVKHQQLDESSADFRVMQYEDAAPEAMQSPAHHSDAFVAVRHRRHSRHISCAHDI